MNRMLRRFISAVLAAVLLLGTVPATLLVASADAHEGHDHTQSSEVTLDLSKFALKLRS